MSDMQKQQVLASIISHGNLKIEAIDFSSGSTITKAGLERACISNGIDIPKPSTKKNLVKALLSYVGKPYVKGDVRKGSTVEKVVLIRILEGLRERKNHSS